MVENTLHAYGIPICCSLGGLLFELNKTVDFELGRFGHVPAVLNRFAVHSQHLLNTIVMKLDEAPLQAFTHFMKVKMHRRFTSHRKGFMDSEIDYGDSI
jgi:hypothetical protein